MDETRIKSIIEGTTLSLGDANNHLLFFYNYYKTQFPNKPDDEINEMCYNALGLKTKRTRFQGATKSEEFMGVILGIGKLWDNSVNLKKECLQMWQQNPQLAVEQKYAEISVKDGSPIFLDYRKTFPNTNSENYSYGKILPEHMWSRTLFGVCSKPDGTDVYPFTMGYDSDKDVPLFKPIKFKASNKTKELGEGKHYILYSVKDTNFEVLDSLKKPTIEEIEKITRHFFIKFSDVYNWHLASKSKGSKLFITKTRIFEIGQPTRTNQRVIHVDDGLPGSTPIQCWVPPYLPIENNLGVNSEILIIGNTSQTKSQSPDSPLELSINLMGLYPINAVSAPAENIEKAELEKSTALPTSTESVTLGG